MLMKVKTFNLKISSIAKRKNIEFCVLASPLSFHIGCQWPSLYSQKKEFASSQHVPPFCHGCFSQSSMISMSDIRVTTDDHNSSDLDPDFQKKIGNPISTIVYR